ncbi:VOC family protein [Rhizobium lentis]|uniref:Aldoketomutase n=1 Tax=Rhizobium lentis TaxID=1138194 RepID=A0A9Q3MB22_9HYPH|nr:VOC family protein [Rhizobium lentis]MBX4955055.1 lactoylglutathione lyase [Rhizobium lentis]MBX4973019.1 lactoylglutathione lyase [Rhizobium lentis]MBX4986838.1 lactoylglutathione lyase [Rhizobium lentis]MBX5001435.1 lactoylglutathione lyase [Rhizobium lentis]MBX5005282.1 lactoylglutathione lyase [Rhizobium lentis]
MAKMIHSMIRVLDEARSVEFYSKAFGLSVADRVDFETFTLIYMSNAETGFELELTVNKGRIEPYALGNAYGHLAVSVQEVAIERERMMKLGLKPGELVELNRDGKLFGLFFFVSDPDGYKIEVLQRHGRFL